MFCIMRSLCSKSSQQSRVILTQRFLRTRPATSILTNETFEEKSARLEPPLSPHLSIYKPKITTILLISQRISATILIIYNLAFIGYYDWPFDVILYIQSLNLSETSFTAIKTALFMPITFYSSNAVRDAIWNADTRFTLTNKGVNITGYGVLAMTVILALSLAKLVTF